MKTFKKPLSQDEEMLYLRKYKEGDIGARNTLIEHNLRLVAHVAKKYQSPEHDSDDLISIGIIGLIKAVMTFDSEKNNRLATYAARCIENEILMMLRSQKKRSREVSMYEQIGTDQDGRELRIMDILESEPCNVLDDMENQNRLQFLKKCIYQNVLDERELQIISERYGLYGKKEKTQREIASSMKISRSYVSRLEKRALEKLRAEFEASAL